VRRLIVLVVILFPALGFAQHSRLEITPTVGYRWGGSIDVHERALEFDDYGVDVDASGTYGLRLGVDMSSNLQLEVLFSRQPGEFIDEHGLFAEWFTAIPDGPDADTHPDGYLIEGRADILDVNVTYIHGGLLWFWGKGENRKYLVGSLGVTRVDPGVPLHTEVGLSASVGAGYRIPLSDKLGLRFEGRAFWTMLDDGAIGVEALDHPDCDIPCTYTYQYPDNFFQFEAMVGLSIKL
jgi:hypothetical protein